MLIQNPEPYLVQKHSSASAIVMVKATLSWTKPAGRSAQPPDTDSGLSKDKADLVSQNGKTKTLPTLRNISFTLPKVAAHCFGTDNSRARSELKAN